jgi:hypothetical protein
MLRLAAIRIAVHYLQIRMTTKLDAGASLHHNPLQSDYEAKHELAIDS